MWIVKFKFMDAEKVHEEHYRMKTNAQHAMLDILESSHEIEFISMAFDETLKEGKY